MLKLGHEVVVISPIPWLPRWIPISSGKWKSAQKQPFFEIYENVKVYYPRVFTIPRILLFFRGFFYYLFLKKLLFRLNIKFNFDIIHCHTVLPDGHIGTLVKKSLIIPVFITIHGVDLEKTARKNKRSCKKIYDILSKSDGIGVVSSRLKVFLNELSPRDIKLPEVRIIYNGIQTYNKYCQFIETRKNLIKQTLRLISIGFLIERKGHLKVLEALYQLQELKNNFQYIIIGDGYFKEKLVQKVKDLNLEKIVKFLGALPHETAMEHLKNADIFVLPSYNEAFGVVYIEAMYFGKITIGSKGEGISEIIIDGNNGYLVDSSDSTDLANKIKYILNHFTELDYIRNNARKTVWPKFSWENNARQYLNFYYSILSRSKPYN